MSELDFLVGEKVVEVHDGGRLVFRAGDESEPGLYADVGHSRCADGEGKPFPVEALRERTVASVSTTGGTLLLGFTDGATLRCDPSEEYEAWQVSGGSPQFLVVCCPGGELAVWDERTPSIRLNQLREHDPAAASTLDKLFESFDMPRPMAFPPADPDES